MYVKVLIIFTFIYTTRLKQLFVLVLPKRITYMVGVIYYYCTIWAYCTYYKVISFMTAALLADESNKISWKLPKELFDNHEYSNLLWC